jgi:hypothetical protein
MTTIPRRTKLILSNVAFTGDSLGPEYEFKFTAAGQAATVKVNMKQRREAIVNRDIFDLPELLEAHRLPLRIDVVEKDEVFDDVGSLDAELAISYPEPREQSITFEITVKGQGREIRKKSLAHVTVVACLDKGIRYVAGLNPNSWLSVRFDAGFEEEIPHLLAVELVEITAQAIRFRILEGRYKGELAQISNSPRRDYLRQEVGVRREAAQMVLRSGVQRLQIGGVGEFSVMVDPRNPIPRGTYRVEIPDEPHDKGAPYLDRAKYARTWFRIGDQGDRYLHTGEVTVGCATVNAVESWDEICKVLLRSRLDSQAVGTLEVLP